MNDRALRQIVSSLGGVANGFPRETGFDITVASEIMAILCLANDIEDLQQRIGDIVIGYRRDRSAVTARDLKADGAMTVLLMKAMQPNLVQTLENNPAFIHGGPFANIAHGCNSVVATRTALKLADYVVTEAGFGADLGAEKFFDIKCRSAGLKPSAAVIVATVRALKMHGGVAKDALGKANVEALKKGCANLGRHIDNVKQFGVPVVVAINKFTSDTNEEIAAVQEFTASHGVEAILCEHWAKGSEGTEGLAHAVVKLAESGAAQFSPLYDDDLPLFEKITQIVTRIYRAEEAVADKKIRDQLREWDRQGYRKLPVCMAKTQYSFSTDPELRGAPTHHVVPIREVRLSAGAGFVVVICGEIMTMPGLAERFRRRRRSGSTRMGWWKDYSDATAGRWRGGMKDKMKLSGLSTLLILLPGMAFAQSCDAEVGHGLAQTYVDQCIEVSPATHPPCNVQNSCELITNEIARGCAMIADYSPQDVPDYCAEYLQSE